MVRTLPAERLRTLFGDHGARDTKKYKAASTPSTWPACHAKFEPGCAQCRFHAFGKKWLDVYGSALHRGVTSSRKVEWLQERRYEPGSTWGLGCAVCSHLRWRLGMSSKDGDHTLSLGGLRCDTRWSRLEVRAVTSMQASAFLQHSQTSLHKVAMHLYLRPQQPLEGIIGDEETASALSVLKGAVPPPEHWVRVWRFVKSPTSFSGAEAILGTEAFIAHLRTGNKQQPPSRKAICKSIGCMAEVIRARTRSILLEARSVTIALDDRGPYRAIRFRCDVAARREEASGASLERHVGYHDGILGVYCTAASPDDSIAVLDDDYSERMRDSVVSAVEGMFRRDGEVDETSVNAVLAKVHTYLADGASSAQKCGVLLRAGRCRNIALILRDPVHAMKTSIAEPLKRHGDFRSFWDDIFDQTHSLVPDIQNSDAWKRRLVLAQRHVVKATGQQGGGLTSALRHLSFAKQRFDSATGPARKFCCLLSAIVVLLATLAGDSRNKPEQRSRAQALIDDMTPARIMTAGLFADYMAECSLFFRLYEKTDHDISRSYAEKRNFLKRMKVLFKEGYVLADMASAVEGGEACPADETCTAIIVSQAIAFGTMTFADRIITLWPAGANRAAEAALAQMGDIVDAATERVDAEMSDIDLVCAFAVFDLSVWQRLRRARQSSRRKAKASVEEADRAQSARAIRLARAMASVTDVQGTARALCVVAEELAAECPSVVGAEAVEGLGDDGDDAVITFDNRQRWGVALARGRCPGELPQLVHWYISILDNTGAVERDLGTLLRHHQAHVGPSPETLQNVFLVSLDGPRSEEELLTSAVLRQSEAGSGMSDRSQPSDFNALLSCAETALDRAAMMPGREYALRLTPFSEACAREWLRRHGRRFGTPAPRPPRPVPTRSKLPRRGTDAAVRASQKRALEQRVQAASGPRAGRLRSLFGGRPINGRSVSVSIPESKKFKDFKELTIAKEAGNAKRRRMRRAGQNPYPVTKSRRGQLFQKPSKTAASSATACPRPPRIRCLNLTRSEVEQKGTAYRMATATVRDLQLLHLIILRDMTAANTLPQDDADLLTAMLAAVAFGVALVPLRTWQRDRDPFTAEQCVRHVPSCEVVPMSVVVSETFAAKHRRCTQLLEIAASGPKSRWKVRTVGECEDGPKAKAELTRRQKSNSAAGGRWSNIGPTCRF